MKMHNAFVHPTVCTFAMVKLACDTTQFIKNPLKRKLSFIRHTLCAILAKLQQTHLHYLQLEKNKESEETRVSQESYYDDM